MPVEQLKKIADEADMIVARYAFAKNAEGLIQVLSLKKSGRSSRVFRKMVRW